MRRGEPAPKVVAGVMRLWEQMLAGDGDRTVGGLHLGAIKGCGYTDSAGKEFTDTQIDTRVAYMREWGMLEMRRPGVYVMHPEDQWNIPSTERTTT